MCVNFSDSAVTFFLPSPGASVLRTHPGIWESLWANSQWPEGASFPLLGSDLWPHSSPFQHRGPTWHQDLPQPPHHGHEVHVLWWEVSAYTSKWNIAKRLNMDLTLLWYAQSLTNIVTERHLVVSLDITSLICCWCFVFSGSLNSWVMIQKTCWTAQCMSTIMLSTQTTLPRLTTTVSMKLWKIMALHLTLQCDQLNSI